MAESQDPYHSSKVHLLNLAESHLQKLVLMQLGCKNTDVMNRISQYLRISESYIFNFSIHIFSTLKMLC